MRRGWHDAFDLPQQIEKELTKLRTNPVYNAERTAEILKKYPNSKMVKKLLLPDTKTPVHQKCLVEKVNQQPRLELPK